MAPGHLKLLDGHISAAFRCAFIRDLMVGLEGHVSSSLDKSNPRFFVI